MYPTYTPLETNRLLSKEELINNVLVKYNGQVDKRRVEKALLMEEVISNRLGSYVCCRIDLYPEFTTEDKPGIYKGFINNFNNYKRKNQWFNDLISYIWTIEKGGKLGRWHCHGAFLWDREYGTNGKQRGWMLKKFLESRMMHDVYGQGIVSGELSYVWVPEPVGNDNVVKEDYISRNRIRENLLYLCKIHREMLQEPNMRLFGTGQG